MNDAPTPDAPEKARQTIALSFAEEEEKFPERIGRYKLLQKLGEGGCGVVFMAEQEEPVKRRVALKVIKLGMDTRQVVARFEAERQALAMMDHPNIARALDAGATENGRPFFVMELVRGIRITDYCDQNKLDANERLQLFTQVCSAIQHAHQKGIIHRDIKPSNILVTMHDGSPVPKVIDFGIAKATQQQLTDKTLFTEIQQFIGTPAYMSPEQAELSGLDIDTRSDVYSLGVLLYELLTGRTPFDPKKWAQSGIDEIRRTIREDEPPRPSTRVSTLGDGELNELAARRHVPAPQLAGLLRGDLDWIVMKCLEKDRTRRYETTNGLAMDVRRFLAHEPVTARPPSAGYRVQKFARRHQWGLAAAAAITVALLLGFGFSTWSFLAERKARARAENAELEQAGLRKKAEAAQAQAIEQKHIAEEQRQKAVENEANARRSLYAADMNLAQQAVKGNNLGRARRLLEGHRPAGTNDADLRGWEWRYLWQQCQSDALFTLTNRPVRAMSADFSQDGSMIAVGFLDGWIGVWNVAERRLLLTVQTNAGGPGFVAFSPTAPILFATGQPGSVQLNNFETGARSFLEISGGIFASAVAFSSDGKRVAAMAGRDQEKGRARVWEVASGKRLQSIDLDTRGSLHQGRLRFSADGEVLFLGGRGQDVEARRVSDGAQIWKTKGAEDLGLTAIAASPDGKFVATGFGFRSDTVGVWTSNGEPVATLRGHNSWVADLDFSADGRRLISAAADQTLRIWDTADWKEIRVLRGHGDEAHTAAFSPDGQLIVSGAKDGAVLVWNAAAAKNPNPQFVFPPGIESIHLLEGAEAVALTRGQAPVLWNVRTRQPKPLPLPAAGIYGYEGDGQLFHYDTQRWATVFTYKTGGFREVARIDVGPGMTSGAWWMKSGAVAVGFPTNRFELMNIKSADRRRSVSTDFREPMMPWRFVDEGRRLIGITNPGELSIWDFDAGERMAGLENIYLGSSGGLSQGRGRKFGFVGVDVAKQPRRLEIFFVDFSKETNWLTRQLVGESRNSVALSPDGEWAASGSDSGKAFLHATATGDLVRVLHGHLNSVSGVAFSPDGKRLVTTSGSPEALKLWDVGTGQEVLNVEGEGALLGTVEFSADGNTVLAGSRERVRTWIMWQAPSWEDIRAVESQP